MNIVIGAGISGLSIGYLLKKRGLNYSIYDISSPGGWCKTYEFKGFRFDPGGHFFHTVDRDVKNFLEELGTKMLTVKRNAFVYFRGRLIHYPIQSNLPDMRFYEYLFAVYSYIFRKRKKNKNLHEFFLTNMGRFLTETFLRGYNEKMWRESLPNLPPDFLGRFVPSLHLIKKKGGGYNPVFLYPEMGIGEVIDSLLSKGLKVHRGKIEQVEPGRVKINGKWIKYGRLYLTIPLPEIVKITPLLSEYRYFKFNGVGMRIVFLGIKGSLKLNAHWIYFPQRKLPFTRAGSFTNISKKMSPIGYSSLWIESPFRSRPPDAERIVDGLTRTGLIQGEVLFYNKMDFIYAYPIRDRTTAKIVSEIEEKLAAHNIFLSGRFGRWEYNTMTDSIKRAMEIV